MANGWKALSLLSTAPAYQRKGLASMLLNHVLDLADAEDRKTYVESTATGYPLYRKFGFRDIDLLSMDLSKWGGPKPGINKILLREPQPVAK
jgi:GNAT superfamily N-acetyltransferase